MEALLEFVRGHRRAFLVACGVLLALTALSVARCSLVHAADTSTESAARKTSRKSRASSSEGETSALTERQRSLVSAYTDDEESFVSSLEAYTWVSTDGKGTLDFDDGAAVRNKGTDSSVSEPFAVLEIPDLLSTAGETQTVTTALVIDGDDEVHVIRVTKTVADGSTETQVESDLFAGKIYTNRNAAKRLKVEGLDNKRLVSALGGDARAIERKVRAWCIENASTATAATWDGTITSNVKEGTESVVFTLVDPSIDEGDSAGMVGLNYSTKDKTLSVATE